MVKGNRPAGQFHFGGESCIKISSKSLSSAPQKVPPVDILNRSKSKIRVIALLKPAIDINQNHAVLDVCD